jgi:hypothetical protein
MYSTKQLKKRQWALTRQIVDYRKEVKKSIDSDLHYTIEELDKADDLIQRAIYKIDLANERLSELRNK